MGPVSNDRTSSGRVLKNEYRVAELFATLAFEREEYIMKEIMKKQILVIRDTGLTNMFDVNNVKSIAEQLEFNELIEYLENHRKEYVSFILYGKEK